MNFYKLDTNGYFFANKSVVKVSEKPDGVKRYIIYKDVEKPTLIPVKMDFYDMKNGEIIEVVTDSLERIFFAYSEKRFVQKYFKPVDILEGEHELEKILGLQGCKLLNEREEMLELASACGIA